MTTDVRGILLRIVPAFVVGLMLSVIVLDKTLSQYPQTQTNERTPAPSLPTIATNLVVKESYSRYRREPKIPPPPVAFTTTARDFTENVLLMILIFSESDSSALRNAVRNTWLTRVKQSSDMSYAFMVGVSGLTPAAITALEAENKENKDMVLLPTTSLKPYHSQLLLHSLSWAVDNVNFKYLLKCNDQTYVTSTRLLVELQQQPKTGLVWGYFSGNEPVTREGDKAEATWNLCSTYLPYAQGGGYILSHDVVAMVTDLGPDLDYLNNEDIALGVWLSPFKHIRRVHDKRINSGPTSRGCLNAFLISHPESISSMSLKYDTVKKKMVICQKEVELTASYIYNWTVGVNNCCNKTTPMHVTAQ